jgi:hypothetical protein
MAKPYIHAIASSKKFGGEPEDYLDIHVFMDSSKSVISHNGHRALTHNSWFIGVVIPKVFGEVAYRKSDGKMFIPKDVAEQHVLEDFGNKYIPTAQDYLDHLETQQWMSNGIGIPPNSVKNKKTTNPTLLTKTTD